RPACWECGGPLRDGRPRRAWAEIKVTDLSRTVVWHRFLVESGDPVVVGRGLTADGISLDLLAASDKPAAAPGEAAPGEAAPGEAAPGEIADPERLRAVSRQHVLLSLDDSGELTVTDLSWKQRTVVHDSTRQSAVLAPDESRPVRERGWIVLAGAVCLVRSARRFVPTARGGLGPSADDRVTRNA
ncbi:hypothetical protein, partial [Actinoplanes philippinensis]|uniref:hypothetical protein n=1 Tax=Actinoplanes philippinensis TaxID=35752 RepID=UPI0033E27153